MAGRRELNMRRRKRRILEAATKLISDGGIEACTMRALARKARLDVTTLYNYYGSKEEILEALRRSGARRLERQIGKLEETEPFERIRAIVDLTLGVSESPAELARPINLPKRWRRPGSGPIGVVAKAHLEKELRRAAAGGDMLPSVDPEQFALVVLGHAGVWLSLWARRLTDAEETLARVGYLVNLCLLAGSTDASRPGLEQEMLESQSRLAAIEAALETAAV
ncbi:MAG: helix-turn-helix domain containing protein [Acidobacteria bacterium]|nr:helix-turn-helix domain containing protein [Acidobacteriota bacterium]